MVQTQDRIDQFLKAWNASDNVDMFLEKKIDLPNPKMIRDHLESLPQEERGAVHNQLASILGTIESHTETISQGLASIKEQLEQSRSAQNMCVSYEKTNAMKE